VGSQITIEKVFYLVGIVTKFEEMALAIK